MSNDITLATSPLHPQVARTAEFSPCGTHRFRLGRTWGEDRRVCFIGLNPSTATHLVDDPTVRRWTHFARAWGYHGFIAVNLYPFRSSTPAACKQWSEYEKNGPDWEARDRMQQNLQIVATTAKACDLVVACWGAGAWDQNWVDHVVEEVTGDVEPWPNIYCFGKSQDGSPMHPMARGKHRIPDTAQPVLWKAA